MDRKQLELGLELILQFETEVLKSRSKTVTFGIIPFLQVDKMLLELGLEFILNFIMEVQKSHSKTVN